MDDWLLGIKGSYEEAKCVLGGVKDFFRKIGLTINMEKTKINNPDTDKVVGPV